MPIYVILMNKNSETCEERAKVNKQNDHRKRSKQTTKQRINLSIELGI